MECVFTSPMRTECGMFVMCCMQCCMSVSTVLQCVDVMSSRRYINVCDSDVFCVGNMYLGHLKFYIVGIDGRRYVCCS